MAGLTGAVCSAILIFGSIVDGVTWGQCPTSGDPALSSNEIFEDRVHDRVREFSSVAEDSRAISHVFGPLKDHPTFYARVDQTCPMGWGLRDRQLPKKNFFPPRCRANRDDSVGCIEIDGTILGRFSPWLSIRPLATYDLIARRM